jgi:hypothetical protein
MLSLFGLALKMVEGDEVDKMKMSILEVDWKEI